MECRQCEYQLWNLRSRICPECGLAFAPSDYRFVPGTVQFRCPHCEQPYYGTDANGHLVPRAFQCVQCQQPIEMDDCLLLPAEGLSDVETLAVRNPWLQRGGRGAVGAWFRTVGMCLARPHTLMEVTPLSAPTRPAVIFALINQLVVGSLLFALLVVAMISMSAAGGGPGGVGIAALFVLGWVGGILLFGVLSIWLWAVCVHLLLRLTGRVQAGLTRTFQALCYSTGASICCVIFCFPFVGMIWWAVAALAMIRGGQRVGILRAIVAVLGGPVLLYCGLSLLMYLSLQATMATARTNAAVVAAALNTQYVGSADAVLAALRDQAEYAGAWPAHALALCNEDGLTARAYMVSGLPRSNLAAAAATAGASTIDWQRFDDLSVAERTAQLRALIAALPADVLAHRVGECVFTYHGIPYPPPADELWLFVATPYSIGGPANNDPIIYQDTISISAGGVTINLPNNAPINGGDPTASTMHAAPGAPAVSQPAPTGPPTPGGAMSGGTALTLPGDIIAGKADGVSIYIYAADVPVELVRQNALRKRFGLPPLPDPRTISVFSQP